MFRIALKSVLARRRRLLTTGLAVVLSVAFISGTMVISDVLAHAVDDLVSDTYRGFDAVVRSSSVQESQFGGQSYRPPIPAADLATVARIPGVRAAAGVVVGTPTLVDRRGQRIATAGIATAVGTNWIDDAALRGRTLLAGAPPRADDELALDRATATDQHLGVGDTITVQAPGGSGAFRITAITGLGSAGDRSSGSSEVRFATSRAQTLFRKEGGFDLVAAGADRGTTEAALATRIRAARLAGTQTVTGTRFIAETQKEFSRVIDLITTFVLGFAFISVFVGIFVIANTFSIIVAQRTREMALLRAVGAGRRQILGAVLTEALVVGAASTAVGVVGGLGLAVGIDALLGRFITLPGGIPALRPGIVAVAAAVGVGATVLSAVVPAVRAMRVPPVAVMNDVAYDRSALSRFRTAAGALMFVAGVVLVAAVVGQWWNLGVAGAGIGAGLLFTAVAVGGPVVAGPAVGLLGRPVRAARGVTGRIAEQNAARNPRRTAITAAALTIGVGLVTVIATFATSLEGSFSSIFATQLARVDAVVDAGTGDTGVPVAVRPALAAVDGVARVTSIRWMPATIVNSRQAAANRADRGAGATPDGTPIGEPRWVLGVDAENLLRMVTLDGLRPAVRTIGDGEIMVMAATARKNGWRVGDDVELSFARTGRHRFRLAATFDTRLSGGEYFVNLATFDANALAEADVDSQVWVQLRPGVTVADVRPRVRSVLRRLAPAAEINDVQTFIAQRTALFTPLLNLIYGLLALAVVIALAGVANTISLSIFERTRELGLLRAVGMTRSQIRASVRWESAIIALLGTVVGVAIGVALAVAFVIGADESGLTPIVPTTQLMVIAVAGGVVGIATALGPARRAARLDVLRALDAY